MKLLVLYVVASSLTLASCKSEVDKCVEAQVSSWQSEKERIESDVAAGKRKYATTPAQAAYGALYDNTLVVKDDRSQAEIEADARFRCLRVSGKN